MKDIPPSSTDKLGIEITSKVSECHNHEYQISTEIHVHLGLFRRKKR